MIFFGKKTINSFKIKRSAKRASEIGALIAAGLLTLSSTGCQSENREPAKTEKTYTLKDGDNEDLIRLGQFRKELQESFSTSNVILNEYSDEFISNIEIDGTDVTIELIDGSKVSGDLKNLEISNMNFENFYIYDSKYIEDYLNCNTIYQNYEENGYDSAVSALFADYDNHEKLNLKMENCSVFNEYKKGSVIDVNWYDNVDYSYCKKIWVYNTLLNEIWLEKISSMPNLETLILTNSFPSRVRGKSF